MRFKKGNSAAKKKGRICMAHPFCKCRIDSNKYPNKIWCDEKCRKYYYLMQKRYATYKLTQMTKKQQKNREKTERIKE